MTMSTPTDEAPPRFMSHCGGGEYSCPGYRGLCSPCAAARRAQRESPAALTGDEAQGLARRWARNVAHGGGVDGLDGVERYRL